MLNFQLSFNWQGLQGFFFVQLDFEIVEDKRGPVTELLRGGGGDHEGPGAQLPIFGPNLAKFDQLP